LRLLLWNKFQFIAAGIELKQVQIDVLLGRIITCDPLHLKQHLPLLLAVLLDLHLHALIFDFEHVIFVLERPQPGRDFGRDWIVSPERAVYRLWIQSGSWRFRRWLLCKADCTQKKQNREDALHL
jgi:hypothetical protein